MNRFKTILYGILTAIFLFGLIGGVHDFILPYFFGVTKELASKEAHSKNHRGHVDVLAHKQGGTMDE